MKILAATTMFSAAVFALSAAADVPVATSPLATFAFNTIDRSPFIVATTEAAAAFADYPLTWQRGETLAVEAPDGTVTTFAADAAAAGSRAFAPTSGGAWKITNPEEGSAYVCVPWSVFGDGGFVCASPAANPFAVDLQENGPNRKVRDRISPPIAYSGDDWAGDVSKAATVTFTPPTGSGLEPTTWNDLSGGNGARAFTFSKSGKWTVLMTFADGTTREATVNVVGGFIVVFH